MLDAEAKQYLGRQCASSSRRVGLLCGALLGLCDVA